MQGNDIVQELQQDLKELETILKSVIRSNVRKIIADEISSLKLQIETLENEHNKKKEDEAPKNSDEKPSTQLYTTKITSYGWDESAKFVKLYVNIPKCNEVSSDQVLAEFTDTSFKLTVKNHLGKNHLLQIVKLAYQIKPESSSCKVKSDNIVLLLRKNQEGQTWGNLTEADRKAKEAKDAKFDSNKDLDNSDPSAGIMNLMKKMYDEGDDDMKRMIKKTWYESQQKQAAGGPPPGVPQI